MTYRIKWRMLGGKIYVGITQYKTKAEAFWQIWNWEKKYPNKYSIVTEAEAQEEMRHFVKRDPVHQESGK